MRDVSAQRVDGVVRTLDVEEMSKSQVSESTKEVDTVIEELRNRPLRRGPYPFVWLDAITRRCREEGRVANVGTMVASAVNADGHREVLGADLITSEDGAGWVAVLRRLVKRRLSGVGLVISGDVIGD